MQILLNFVHQMPVALMLILSATSVVLGDLFAKFWSINQKGWFFGIALVGYFLSGLFYIPTLLKKGLVLTSVIWSLLSIIGFLFIGLVLFKESLMPVQIVGITLGVIALILLSL